MGIGVEPLIRLLQCQLEGEIGLAAPESPPTISRRKFEGRSNRKGGPSLSFLPKPILQIEGQVRKPEGALLWRIEDPALFGEKVTETHIGDQIPPPIGKTKGIVIALQEGIEKSSRKAQERDLQARFQIRKHSISKM